jgi:hypothetical protein
MKLMQRRRNNDEFMGIRYRSHLFVPEREFPSDKET